MKAIQKSLEIIGNNITNLAAEASTIDKKISIKKGGGNVSDIEINDDKIILKIKIQEQISLLEIEMIKL